jgi:hypothetical protein
MLLHALHWAGTILLSRPCGRPRNSAGFRAFHLLASRVQHTWREPSRANPFASSRSEQTQIYNICTFKPRPRRPTPQNSTTSILSGACSNQGPYRATYPNGTTLNIAKLGSAATVSLRAPPKKYSTFLGGAKNDPLMRGCCLDSAPARPFPNRIHQSGGGQFGRPDIRIRIADKPLSRHRSIGIAALGCLCPVRLCRLA